MQYANALSELLLAGACLFVFFRFCRTLPLNNRIVWGVFLVLVAATAIVGICKFLGMSQLNNLHQHFVKLSNTAGVVSLMMGIGALVWRIRISNRWFVMGMLLGLVLFVLFLLPNWSTFTIVVTAFAILMSMMMAVYGLSQRNKAMIWVILGIMAMGVATKIPYTDVYHYTMAFGIYLLGKGVDSSN